MRTFLSMMKKKSNAIPEEKLLIFDNIISTYFVPGRGSSEGDNKFMEAIGELFTEEERFRLWEQSGGCNGTGHDKERKAFALEHADIPLPVRLDIYLNTLGKRSTKTRSVVLNEEENTITVTFACDECYNKTLNGRLTAPFNLYYESCAGGRMYVLEKSLGIKLKIKSVEIPHADIGKENPCVYTFEIVG